MELREIFADSLSEHENPLAACAVEGFGDAARAAGRYFFLVREVSMAVEYVSARWVSVSSK